MYHVMAGFFGETIVLSFGQCMICSQDMVFLIVSLIRKHIAGLESQTSISVCGEDLLD